MGYMLVPTSKWITLKNPKISYVVKVKQLVQGISFQCIQISMQTLMPILPQYIGKMKGTGMYVPMEVEKMLIIIIINLCSENKCHTNNFSCHYLQFE